MIKTVCLLIPNGACNIFAAILVTVFFLPNSAFAILTICNKGAGNIMVAISHSEGMSAGQYQNLGWLNVEAGKCQSYSDLSVKSRYLYYYAEDEVGNVWKDDSSGHKMCVSKGSKFIDIYSGGSNCPRSDMLVKKFAKLDTGDSADYTLNLTGSESRVSRANQKIDLLDVGDGVYVQGFFSDELVHIVRIDKSDNTVKVRRSSDGTTQWISVDRIITREQSAGNDVGRAVVGGAILYCIFAPEQCKN